MSLIDKLPELRERLDRNVDLEFHNLVPQLLPGHAWDLIYLMSAYPKTLEVLGCFQPEDHNILAAATCAVELLPCLEDGDEESQAQIIAGLKRLQKAAEILEA